jgi:hypothetical protein
MGVSIGGIGALISGGSALAGLLGGGSNQPAAPPPGYMPQNLGGADAGAYSAMSNLPNYNSAGQTLGQYGGITQNLVNNPYANLYQGGANNIAPWATGAGGQQYGAGSNMIGVGQSYLPYAQQTLQTGFDPQQTLYNQQFQQNTDQTRAAEAARGVATTPYGAGVENMSNINFNNQWQNQQLARQGQAATTAGALTGAAGNALTTGTAGQTAGLNTMLQGASLPYSTANTIGTGQQTALNAYGQYGTGATSTAQQQIADFLQYLGVGNQSAGVANQAYANQLTANNQQFNQQQTLGKNLGSSLSGLGTYFGNGSGAAPQTIANIGNYSMPGYK